MEFVDLWLDVCNVFLLMARSSAYVTVLQVVDDVWK